MITVLIYCCQRTRRAIAVAWLDALPGQPAVLRLNGAVVPVPVR
jgi:hypothetical protein